ncbi:MAG: hypothetical protein ACRCYQ_09800 [Nocardioides sp.]
MRRRRTFAHLVATGAIAVLAALSGCSGSDRLPGAKRVAGPTPLAEFVTDGLEVHRGDFCGRIPMTAIRRALSADDAPSEVRTYGSGDPVLTGEESAGPDGDLAAEYGCEYGHAGRAAEAWVFAPPIRANRAARLVRQIAGRDGCTPLAGAPRFGSPTTALTCPGPNGLPVASFHGLFGDAWLSCSLTTTAGEPEAGVIERAGSWCVAVANAAHEAALQDPEASGDPS